MDSHSISFLTASGHIALRLPPGSTILITGPNGVGKSALLSTLYRSIPQPFATYLPGHRQINFNSGWDTFGQDAEQLKRNLFSQVEHFSRIKGAWAEDQFKLTLRTLLHSEAAYNRAFRTRASLNSSNLEETASKKLSPVDTLNLIFQGARLPVQFILDNDGLSAKRDGSIYAIDALSDGERAALFIVSAIVTQAPNTVILVDEPEKHLHPSITSLLVETALRARPDISAVLSSHDVHLIERLAVSHVIHIRNSSVVGVRPERRVFEADVLQNIEEVPDNLKTELLGARNELLFVEGISSSSDVALYGHIYEDVKVSPKGGHDKVTESVKALRGMSGGHWLKPYGLIDGDGRDVAEREILKAQGIYVLPCPTIENLFFLDEMINCFVEANLAYSRGKTLQERIAELAEICYPVALRHREDIIARRVSWALERRLNASKLSPKQIKEENLKTVEIPLGDIYQDVASHVNSVIETKDWKLILHSLPIKNTAIPANAALALGAPSFDEYRKVILRQLDVRSSAAEIALRALRALLPVLHASDLPTSVSC